MVGRRNKERRQISGAQFSFADVFLSFFLFCCSLFRVFRSCSLSPMPLLSYLWLLLYMFLFFFQKWSGTKHWLVGPSLLEASRWRQKRQLRWHKKYGGRSNANEFVLITVVWILLWYYFHSGSGLFVWWHWVNGISDESSSVVQRNAKGSSDGQQRFARSEMSIINKHTRGNLGG